ncbi:hypothetical protein D3C72_1307860 [compost metagenome]
MIRHQMTVEFAPDQLVKPYRPRPAVEGLRLFGQQAVQTLTRGEHAQRQTGG